MNKYIKAVFCVPLAGIKYAILKIENGGRFHAAFPAIMSPMTEVTVDGKSELRIAKKLKMHNGAKIRVRKGGKLEIGKNFRRGRNSRQRGLPGKQRDYSKTDNGGSAAA